MFYITINSNTAGLASNGSSQTPSIFFCPKRPIFTWIVSDTTTFYIVAIINLTKRSHQSRKAKRRDAKPIVHQCWLPSFSCGGFICDAVSFYKIFNLSISRIAFANQLATVRYSLFVFVSFATVIAWKPGTPVVMRCRPLCTMLLSQRNE